MTFVYFSTYGSDVYCRNALNYKIAQNSIRHVLYYCNS